MMRSRMRDTKRRSLLSTRQWVMLEILLLANGLIVDIEHPVLGKMKMVGPPVQMSETPVVARSAAPSLGANTEEILTEVLRLPKARIERLRAAGAI